MGNAKHVGRVGALAAALGVGNVRRTATRMTVSIGVAALVVMATVVPVSTASDVRVGPVRADVTCALILGGTACPTPDDAYIDAVKNQYIAPTHPGQDIDYVAGDHARGVVAHHGALRLVGRRAWGSEAASDLVARYGRMSRGGNSRGSSTSPLDQSIQAGVADLEAGDGRAPATTIW